MDLSLALKSKYEVHKYVQRAVICMFVFSYPKIIFIPIYKCANLIYCSKYHKQAQIILIKAAYSVTMNIFRKKNFFFLNHLQK